MNQVDEMIYDAICADSDLTDAVGSRVVSTCFEVSPDEQDNTPLPNIIVTYDGFQNQSATKDDIWESQDDQVQVGVEVAARSPQEVKTLISSVRRAIGAYMTARYEVGAPIPSLVALTSDGIAWDWMKPCYYQRLTYQCTITTDTADNEQEND